MKSHKHRQQKVREKNTAVNLRNEYVPLLDELVEKFGAEINDPTFARPAAFARMVVECHSRYCGAESATSDVTAGLESRAVTRDDHAHSEVPSATKLDREEPDLPEIRGAEEVLLEEEIRASCAERLVHFRNGIMWLKGPEHLVVKLTGEIDRKWFLKQNGFRCDYQGDKSWSTICAESSKRIELAVAIHQFMSLPPAAQVEPEQHG